MSTITLPVVFSNASAELDVLVPLLLQPDYSLAVVQRTWRSYRIRGAVQLFLTGSAAGFFDNLQKSAQLGVHHLGTRGPDGIALSRLTPFLDAVACGNVGVSERIVELCRDAVHLPELEYIDDYLYVRYLMARWQGDRVAAAEALSEFRRLLDGASSAQLAICEGLETMDARALDDGLVARLDEHDDYYRLLVERGAVTEDEWVSQAHLSVEGLAIIRLATRLGLTMEPNYRFVPSIVIRARPEALPGNAWQQP